MKTVALVKQNSIQLSFSLGPTLPEVPKGRRAIEEDFPFLEISRLAQFETYRKNIYRPAYYIHKWWARRTGATFRAILLGTLLPAGFSLMDFFYQANNFEGVVILDPFMGGGTTIGEALRLGTKVIGVDINPVSWFLVKKIVEAVSLDALDAAYRHLEATVGQEIRRLYETTCPTCGGPAEAIYTYWVKLVPCRNCGATVPLRKSMVLAPHASKPHTGLVTCLACGHPFVSSSLNQVQHCPECGTSFDARQGFSKGAFYTCPNCGTRDRIIRALQGQEMPPQHTMVAIHTYCSTCGKSYKKPDERDKAAYEKIKRLFATCQNRLLYPRTPIPAGYNTAQMIKYNYRFWFQMFNERQLLGLSMLLEAILALEDPDIREMMLLLFSSVLEFNNMFCSPKGLGTGAVRHLFAHHAFIPAKEPLEANLWGVERSSGGFSTLYRSRLRRGKLYAQRPVERRILKGRAIKVPIPGERIEARLASSFEELVSSPDKRVLLLNRSSASLEGIPDANVDAVITDPPYLGNVMYSELSDFFYAWLRLGLKDIYTQFAPLSVDRAEEAIKNEEQGKDADFYQNILAAVFRECHRVLKDEGLLVFTFHHGAAEAWDALAQALVSADFVIVSLWPVYAEMDVGVPVLGKQAVKFDSILVCRKRRAQAGPVVQDAVGLAAQINSEVAPFIEVLEKHFSLTAADKTSLFLAVATKLFTQRQINMLPSAIISARASM